MPFQHFKHLLNFVRTLLAFFISLMDPLYIPMFRVIHKFRTRKHNVHAVLVTKTAGGTRCSKVSHNSNILCVNWAKTPSELKSSVF